MRFRARTEGQRKSPSGPPSSAAGLPCCWPGGASWLKRQISVIPQGHDDELAASAALHDAEVMHAGDSGHKALGPDQAKGGLAVCFCMEVRDSLPDSPHGCGLSPEAPCACLVWPVG